MPHRIIPSHWSLPKEIVRRIGTTGGRQRSMHHDGHLLAILHAPPQPGEAARKERLFWRSPEGQWQSSEFGTGARGLRTHLEEYERRVKAIDDALDHRLPAAELFRLTMEITPLHRAARNAYEALQHLRAQSGDDRDVIDARDHAAHLERTLELLRLEAKDALDYRVAAEAERQARAANAMAASGQRLNVLAALFFPLVTLSGVFGMNLATGVETREGVFWIVVGAGLVLGVMLWGAAARARPV